MKRTDRHFKIITYLQGRRRAVTADQIAQECEVSTRTIYRDIADMMASGVPVTGEAGVGYLLDQAYHLPPLSFDVDEIEALVLGMAMVNNWTDEKMGRSARSALDKIKRALPGQSREALFGTALFSYRSASHVPWDVDFTVLRKSIREKKKLNIEYADGEGNASNRMIRPLALAFFGPVWLLLGWCELRHGFRNFRVDRIRAIKTLEVTFKDEAGKRLSDYTPGAGFSDPLRDN